MSAAPESFRDDLSLRASQLRRFRQVGNPYAFLNEIGITPIVECIYKGNLLLDVAEQMNVSLTILRKWVEEEGHGATVEDAETISAEGFLAEGMRLVRTAENAFQLSKAKEMIRHAQYMASKKNKKTYGNTDAAQQGAGVQYVFNIGQNTTAPQMAKDVLSIIEHAPQDVQHLPNISMNLLDHLLLEAEQLDPERPIGSIDFGSNEPEIGPFYGD